MGAKQQPKIVQKGKEMRLSRGERNSAIEVLRIISMLFIVLSHACYHGEIDRASAPITLNKLFLQWSMLGGIGVNIFFMISGYFLCEREFKLFSVSRLLAQGWFYTIALFLVGKFGFGYNYSMSELLMVFLPTLFYEYWFLTAYLILLFLSPYINALINALSRKQNLLLIVTTVTLWVGIRTFTTSEMLGTAIPFAVTMYLIGAYLRKYPENWLAVGKNRVFLTVASFGLLFASTLVVAPLAARFPGLQEYVGFFYARNSLLTVGAAAGLMAIFLHCKPFQSKFINTVAGCTFGVYLIHENPAMRVILWERLLNNAPYIDSAWLIPRVLAAAVIVFCGGAVIEYLRQLTVDKPMTKIIHWALSKLSALALGCTRLIFKR